MKISWWLICVVDLTGTKCLMFNRDQDQYYESYLWRRMWVIALNELL